jgi:hypothetical protein
MDDLENQAHVPTKGLGRFGYYVCRVIREGITGVWRPIDLLWGAGMIAVVVALFAVVTALAGLGWAWFLAASFWVLFLVTAIGGYRVWSPTELAYSQVAAERRPHLVFAGTSAATAMTIVGSLGGSSLTPVVGVSASAAQLEAVIGNYYVRVFVANDPGEQIGDAARSVAAKIAFLNDAGELLIPEMIGRWSETPQRLQTGRLGLTLEESQLDIEANGLPHALDIAMKEPAEHHFYAFNHENSQAANLCLEAHRLDVAKCQVRVTLRAANSPSIIRTFELRNEGVGGGLRLEDCRERTP